MGVNFTPLITPLNLMKIQIVENHEGRLRLRWHDGDKKYTLALGVKHTPVGRSQSTAIRHWRRCANDH
jgi:hypothetical protein